MTIPMLLIKFLILQFQDEKDNNEDDEDEEEEDDGDVSICFFPEASILFFSKSCTSMDTSIPNCCWYIGGINKNEEIIKHIYELWRILKMHSIIVCIINYLIEERSLY